MTCPGSGRLLRVVLSGTAGQYQVARKTAGDPEPCAGQ